jgi:hypothetical protein
MWIPLFPYSKRMAIWCDNCGTEFQLQEIAPQLQPQVKEFYRRRKAPFWQWVGLLLIMASMVSGIISGICENKNTKTYFESPEINDVYCVKYDTREYSLMYIEDIREDSVYFIVNDYTTKKSSSVTKLHRPDFYETDVVYGFSRYELNDMFYEEKSITQIWRNLKYSREKTKLREPDIQEGIIPLTDEEEDEEEDLNEPDLSDNEDMTGIGDENESLSE